MRRRLATLAAFALFGSAACTSSHRPVRQLETLDVMVGGTLHAPGAEFDAEVSGWLRMAPWRYVDLTVGGTFTVPIFEPIAYGGLAEVRGHIPITDRFRLTLAGAGELLHYELDADVPGIDNERIWVQRLTATALAVWTPEEKDGLTPYFGPKVVYLSDMDDVLNNDLIGTTPGFVRDGDGVYFLGGTFGVEFPSGPLRALGGALDIGSLFDAQDEAPDGLTMTFSFYVGY